MSKSVRLVFIYKSTNIADSCEVDSFQNTPSSETLATAPSASYPNTLSIHAAGSVDRAGISASKNWEIASCVVVLLVGP